MKHLLKRFALLTIAAVLCVVTASAQTDVRRHTVVAGETLYGLSGRYGVSIEQILALNPSVAEHGLRADTEILIPAATTGNGNTGSNCRTTHKVQKKETLYSISKQYGVTIDQIVAANPSLASANAKLKKGTMLCIPYSTADSIAYSTRAVSGYKQLRLAVVLPLTSKRTEAQRCLEFYRGVLMAVEKMKKAGTDVHVFTYDEPAAKESLSAVMKKVTADKPQLIIGPLYPDHFDDVASAVKSASGQTAKWVVPFSSKYVPRPEDSNVFLLNAPDEDRGRFTADLFFNTFGRQAKAVVLSSGRASETRFTTALKSRLTTLGVTVSTLPIVSPEQLLTTEVKSSAPTLFIIDDTSLDNLRLVAPIIARLHQKNAQVGLIGYPDWSDETSVQDLLYNANTYVVTPHYYNEMSATTRAFAADYQRWFATPLLSTDPRMAPLGYDACNYLFLGLKTYGADYIGQSPSASAAPAYCQTAFTFQPLYETVAKGPQVNAATAFLHYLPAHSLQLIEPKQ